MADLERNMIPGGDVDFSLVFGAAETTKTIRINNAVNTGYRLPYIYEGWMLIPLWANDVTLDVNFKIDVDGTELSLDNTYTALARNGNRQMTNLRVQNSRYVDMVLTLSGVPGGSGGTLKGIIFSNLTGGGAASGGGVDSDVNVLQFGSQNVSLVDTDKPVFSPLIPRVSTTQKVIDLPANSSAPAEIDCSGATVYRVLLYVAKEFRYCYAADQTAANTAIESDASREILPSGRYPFYVGGDTTNKLYIESNDASALTDGASYRFEVI